MKHTLEIPAADLRQALSGLSHIIKSRSTLPVLQCLRLDTPGDGMLHLEATDLESYAACRIPLGQSDASFPRCLVVAKPLQTMLRGLKDNIRLEHDSDRGVSLHCQAGGTTIAHSLEEYPLNEWPQAPVLAAVETTRLPDSFKSALRQALDCASRDDSRAVLNGACLDVTRADCHCLVASDGRQLYAANTFRFDLQASVTLPSRKFLTWRGFEQDGPWQIAVQRDREKAPVWIRLQSDHWTWHTPAIPGQFPNWRQVTPAADTIRTRVVLGPEASAMLLETIPRLPEAPAGSASIIMEVHEGVFRIRTQPQPQSAVVVVPVKDAQVSGEDVDVALDRRFLLRALRYDLPEIELTDALTAVVFRGEGRQFLAMPMRLAGPNGEPSRPVPEADQDAPEETPPSATAAPSTSQAEKAPPQSPTSPKEDQADATDAADHSDDKPEAPVETDPLASALERQVRLRSALRELLADCTETQTLLRNALREQRAVQREVKTVRTRLRSLQDVQL